MQQTLWTRTQLLVAEVAKERGKLQVLASETDISYQWLYRLSRGDKTADNVHYIETLFNKLSGKRLGL